MIKKILYFVQYHNFFTIAVMVLFFGTGVTFAANPDSIIAKNETVKSIDNTAFLAENLEQFDPKLAILSVSQDDELYYVEYSYTTFDIIDAIWQPITEEAVMKVTRKELGLKDLGVYVAEELGQVISTKLAYLKESQKLEKEKGEQKKVVAVEYSGLVGKFLSPNEKSFEGYTPVKAPVDENPTGAAMLASSGDALPADQQLVSRDEVKDLVEQSVRDLLREMQDTGSNVAVAQPSSSSMTTTATAATSTASETSAQTPAVESSQGSSSPAQGIPVASGSAVPEPTATTTATSTPETTVPVETTPIDPEPTVPEETVPTETPSSTSTEETAPSEVQILPQDPQPETPAPADPPVAQPPVNPS